MAKQLSLKEILALPLNKQALVLEERRSIARLREIKQMAASLALLEPLQEQIKAAGHTINADSSRWTGVTRHGRCAAVTNWNQRRG